MNNIINLFINLNFYKMKKFFYVAAAFLAAGFVSCSDNGGDNAGVPGANDGRLPIVFSVTDGRVDIKQQAPATRGNGAVGDIATGNNVWRGEELNVYMFDKGTLTRTKDLTGVDTDVDLFNNEVVLAPNATTAGTALSTVETGKYYPMSGNFDFFAYHADDAANGAVVESADNYTLPVLIDGSQDLMVAKADLTAGQDALLGARATDYYSAYSARRGVHPHFLFKHLLTRLVFNVKAHTEAEESVQITAVEISNANTTADMVIAWTGAAEPTAYFLNPDNAASVFLKERDADDENVAKELVALQPVNPVYYDNDATKYDRVGESLMLMPQPEYNMVVHMNQEGKNGEKHNVSLEAKLTKEFKAGYQYNVNITVYGLQEIKLELELAPWLEGEDIPVDDEN